MSVGDQDVEGVERCENVVSHASLTTIFIRWISDRGYLHQMDQSDLGPSPWEDRMEKIE